MFNSDVHLPQILAPEAYYSTEQYELEFARLFARGWHAVGSTADIPHTGDYFTRSLGSISLLVRNFDGEYHCFLNVCAHRFCEIVSDRCGHQDEFACQYHGWEFDKNGDTKRIPDAPSFKPLEKGMLGLTRFRTALCGQLIFVSLASDGPDLRTYLGSGYEAYETNFSAPYEQVLSWDVESDSNWKLGVENGVESYHIDCVHKSTFGKMPPAVECFHELHDDKMVFHTKPSPARTWITYVEEAFALSAGQKATHDYVNVRSFPSLTCSRTDTVTGLQSILPLSPTRSIHIYRLFMPRPLPGNLRIGLLYRFYRPQFVKYWKAVMAEDQSILPKSQRGVSAPVLPKGGLISTREELVFHFQRYVARSCGLLPESNGELQTSTMHASNGVESNR